MAKIYAVAARVVINTTVYVEANSAGAAGLKVGGMPSKLLLSELDHARMRAPDAFDLDVEVVSVDERK